jgi:hypothetical protein
MALSFAQAVERVSEVVMFENWLRFYFIDGESDDALFIRVPEQGMEKLKKNYPQLFGLAEQLNNGRIDHASSVREVCLFVAAEIDGRAIPEAMVQRVFSSPEFAVNIHLFSMWVQAHEEQLDKAFMEFSLWRSMFDEWLKSDAIREMVKELTQQAAQTSTDQPETVQ